MKKFIMVLVCLMTMVVSAYGHNTHYPTYTEDGITYVATYVDKNGKFGGWEVLKVDKPNSKTIIVPSEITIDGEAVKVGKIRESAFSTCVSLDSLIISDGLTIGNCHNTFKGCKQLEYLYYSNGGIQLKANWGDGQGPVHDMEYYGLSCKTFETSFGCGEKPFWDAIKVSLEKIIIRDTDRCYTLMNECPHLKTIVCYAENPPYTSEARSPYVYTCGSAYVTFESWQWSTITLYVPRESLENYYFDNVWGEIDNIYAIDEMNEIEDNITESVNPITNNTIINDTWYSLGGQKVDKPTKGMYVKNGKKYIIK